MLVASATYSSRAKSRKGLPAEEKEEERKTTIETALSPSKAPETSARRRSALKGARWKAHLSSSSSSIEGHDYIIILFLLSNGENRKERGKKNEREREKAPSCSCSSRSLSFLFLPAKTSNASPKKHPSTRGPRRRQSAPSLRPAPSCRRRRRSRRGTRRRGRRPRRTRRRAAPSTCRRRPGRSVGVFFFFFPVAGGREAKGREEGSERAANKATRIDAPPAPPSE